MRTCNCCSEELSETQFANGGSYVDKKGKQIYYKRKTCKQCYAGQNRNSGREARRDKIHSLLSWAAPLLLTIVVGIYQFDSVSGRLRTCTYSSVYGYLSVTIDAMNMCPLTWEFDV